MNDSTTAELKKIARLLAMSVVEGKSRTEQILALTEAGFSPKDIAELLHTTPNTVSVAIYQNQRRSGTKGRKRGKKA